MNFAAYLGPKTSAWVVEALAHVLWQGTLIAALAAAATVAFRSRSAQARYSIHCAAMLLAAACLPLNLWLLAATDRSERTDVTRGVLTDSIELALDPANIDQAPVAGNKTLVPIEATRFDKEAAKEAAEPWAHTADSTLTWEWASPWIVGAYLAGIGGMAIRLLLGLYGCQRLRTSAKPIGEERLREVLAGLGERLRLKVLPVVAYSARVTTPLVVGVVKPAILLPAAILSDLTTEQVESLLLHELAHIRRYDHWANLLQRVLETVLFFHPAVWWLSRQVSIEREHCCDDLAIRWGSEPCDYAESLVRLSEARYRNVGLRGGSAATLAATGNRSSQLRRRVLRVLGMPLPGPSVGLTRVGVGVLLMVALASAVLIAATPEETRNESSSNPVDANSGETEGSEAKDDSVPTSLVEEWQQALASDSTARQVRAAAEIAERLTDKPNQTVDLTLIPSLARLLGGEDFVTHGNNGRGVGDWSKEALIKIGPAAVAELIKVTNEGDKKARGQAAEALGAIKTVGPKGVEALIELLKHPDYEAHGAAANALKQLTAEPTLIPNLIEACEQGELNPRCLAVGVLGRLPDERGDAVLLKALDAPERDLRLWAAHAVQETPRPTLAPQLVARLKTDDREIRQNLETALRITAKSNIPALLDGLKDDDARVRAACVFALAHLLPDQAPRVVPALTAVLNDDDASVRLNIFYLMQLNGRLFDADFFIGPLVKGLSDSDAQLRASAAGALQRFAETWPNDRRAIQPLLKALNDSEPDVIVNAIGALAAFRERQAIARLTQLTTVGGRTGEAASHALGVLGDQTSRDILRQNLAKKQPGAIEALGKLRDRESIPQFIELLNSDDESVRAAAAGALALNPDPRAIEPLIASLKLGVGVDSGLRHDRNNSTRAVAGALGRSGDPRAIAALIEQIPGAAHVELYFEENISADRPPIRLDDRLVHHPFAWSLFHAGSPALPELAKGLTSPSSITRQVCAWALDNLASQGGLEPADFDNIRQALLTGLHDDDPVVRFLLVKTVSDLKLPEAEPILLEMLETPLPKTRNSETAKTPRRPIDLSPAAQIQVEVIRALFRLKTDLARDTVLRALQHPEPAVRTAAAGHLGGIPAALTVEPLLKALSDPSACAEAARVLGHIGDARAVGPLIELLNSNPNVSVQANAAQSLGLLGAAEAKTALRDVLNRIPVGDPKSEQFATQVAAAVSLVQLHDDAGTARLKELLGSSDYETRSHVASALGGANYFSEWRPPAALSHEPTREVLRHYAEHAPDASTRLQLFEALSGQLDQTTREFLERHAREPQERNGWAVWRVLVRPNPAAYEEQLLELLDQNKTIDVESNRVRREIAFFLGQIPTQRATDRLLFLTSDVDDEVRVAVVSALGKRRSPKVDARLRELSTNDPSFQVRARARSGAGVDAKE